MKAAGPFTRMLWDNILPVYEEITGCPFVTRLAEGTLPLPWFAEYISQDALYLVDDSRALAITAAKAERKDELYFFLQLAKDGLDIERSLQEEFFSLYNIKEAERKLPVTEAYTSFLLHHAYNSTYAVAVAALLPCFWVYNETGNQIIQNSVAGNPYQKWIDTYSGELYEDYTRSFIDITERLGQTASPEVRSLMQKAFTEGTKYELAFFNLIDNLQKRNEGNSTRQ